MAIICCCYCLLTIEDNSSTKTKVQGLSVLKLLKYKSCTTYQWPNINHATVTMPCEKYKLQGFTHRNPSKQTCTPAKHPLPSRLIRNISVTEKIWEDINNYATLRHAGEAFQSSSTLESLTGTLMWCGIQLGLPQGATSAAGSTQGRMTLHPEWRLPNPVMTGADC